MKDFLKSGDEWLLSWHSDVIGHPQTLMRLLSWNKPIVSALVFMRGSPAFPHIWAQRDGDTRKCSHQIRETRKWFLDHPEYVTSEPFVMEPRPDDALIDLDGGFTSTSCMLIHRSVLEAMRPIVKNVWFKRHSDLSGGEDWWFCTKAREAGFETYVDRSCCIGHMIGDTPATALDFMVWDYVSDVFGTGENPVHIGKKVIPQIRRNNGQ